MALTKSLKEIIAGDKTGLLAKHASWERVCLRDVAEVLNGYPFDSNLFQSANGTPLIRIRDVQTGSTKTFFSGEFDNQFLVYSGELLIGMDGDFYSARWKSQPSLLNQRVCKLTVDERLYSGRLLEFVLPGFLAAIHAETSSITVKHLSSRSIQEIELPLPPAAEQTRIVEKLEELLSGLDAGVAELKAAQKKLTRYRQSLLKAAVEGALTAQWCAAQSSGQPDAPAPSAESGAALLARILSERRSRWEARQLAKFAAQGKTPSKDWQAKYPAPAAPDTAGLPALPEGWVWASLNQLVSDSSYGTSVKCSYESQGVAVLRIPNVVARKLVLDDLKYATQPLGLEESEYLAPGDILIVRTNGSIGLVGRAAEVSEVLPRQFYFASYLLRVRCIETVVLHRWISAVLASNLGRKWIEARAASSAGLHNISLSTLLTMPVPLPPLVEQSDSLNSLEMMLSNITRQEEWLDVSLKQSAAQRKNILQAAFSGQLVPQDPADEPASALLARIRAERAARASGAVRGRGKKKDAA